MAYFRKLNTMLETIYSLLSPEESWLILINADPDAIASALALRRLIRQKVKSVTISNINEITRPDNLAMIRILRIPMVPWNVYFKSHFQRFALVDSQPHHSPEFEGIDFDIVIDHHPVLPDFPVHATVVEVQPELGSCSTILTELLYNAKTRLGRRLATALQYGIRVDTASFGRRSSEVDLRAYHYLSRSADHEILMQIARSEYLPEWLPFFAYAIESLRPCEKGYTACINEVDSPDLLVVVADFFQKVHGFQWVVVTGHYLNKVVIVFRGNGTEDLGVLAAHSFGELGSAGGHRQMARAEFESTKLCGEDLQQFVYKKLSLAFITKALPEDGTAQFCLL